MKEQLIVILGDDTPEEVKKEVAKFKDSASMNFSWDNEDNENMPKTAKYLEDRYNVFRCVII